MLVIIQYHHTSIYYCITVWAYCNCVKAVTECWDIYTYCNSMFACMNGQENLDCIIEVSEIECLDLNILLVNMSNLISVTLVH